ncbi:hypothetical protein UPYG_G00036810 [Umbra pygmaea]|uniref:Iodothyronine deiodinase n=1 Tax=Umbra pygmaea TaxID=75934 RepID=A0ABD0XP21_UMBPY
MILIRKCIVYLLTPYFICLACIQFLYLNLLNLISPSWSKKVLLKMGEKTNMSTNPRFRYEDWGPTFMSLNFIKGVIGFMWTNLGEEAFVGNKAPDSPLVTLDGKTISIYKYLKDSRPLVLNFGSYFLVVYISEAHSTDGWVFANNFDINKHQNLEERFAAAQILVKEDPLCPIVVDNMADTTATQYGALPERLYVLQAGRVIYKGKRGPSGYRPMEVRSFLEKMK